MSSSQKRPASDLDPEPNISELNFEQAMGLLEEIVRQLEEQKGGLDEAITLYERGVRLKQHCEQQLQVAQNRIDKVIQENDKQTGLKQPRLEQTSLEQTSLEQASLEQTSLDPPGNA